MKKIIYSPGFGAGWATWNDFPVGLGKFLAEYEPLIEWLESDEATEENKYKLGTERYDTKHPLLVKLLEDAEKAGFDKDRIYFGGLKDAVVMEISDDAHYKIEEYDGNEYVIFKDAMGWW